MPLPYIPNIGIYGLQLPQQIGITPEETRRQKELLAQQEQAARQAGGPAALASPEALMAGAGGTPAYPGPVSSQLVPPIPGGRAGSEQLRAPGPAAPGNIGWRGPFTLLEPPPPPPPAQAQQKDDPGTSWQYAPVPGASPQQADMRQKLAEATQPAPAAAPTGVTAGAAAGQLPAPQIGVPAGPTQVGYRIPMSPFGGGGDAPSVGAPSGKVLARILSSTPVPGSTGLSEVYPGQAQPPPAPGGPAEMAQYGIMPQYKLENALNQMLFPLMNRFNMVTGRFDVGPENQAAAAALTDKMLGGQEAGRAHMAAATQAAAQRASTEGLQKSALEAGASEGALKRQSDVELEKLRGGFQVQAADAAHRAHMAEQLGQARNNVIFQAGQEADALHMTPEQKKIHVDDTVKNWEKAQGVQAQQYLNYGIGVQGAPLTTNVGVSPTTTPVPGATTTSPTTTPEPEVKKQPPEETQPTGLATGRGKERIVPDPKSTRAEEIAKLSLDPQGHVDPNLLMTNLVGRHKPQEQGGLTEPEMAQLANLLTQHGGVEDVTKRVGQSMHRDMTGLGLKEYGGFTVHRPMESSYTGALSNPELGYEGRFSFGSPFGEPASPAWTLTSTQEKYNQQLAAKSAMMRHLLRMRPGAVLPR